MLNKYCKADKVTLILAVIFLFLPVFVNGIPTYLKLEGNILNVAHADGIIEQWDMPSYSLLKKVSDEKLDVWAIQKDDSKFYLGGVESTLLVVDIKSSLSTKINLTPEGIIDLLLDKINSSLYFSSFTGELGVLNLTSMQVSKKIQLEYPTKKIVIQDSVLYAISERDVIVLDPESLATIRNFSVLSIPDIDKAYEKGDFVVKGLIEGNKIYLSYLNGKVRLWNLNNGSLIKEIQPDDAEVKAMISDDEYIYSSRLFPLSGGEIVVLDKNLNLVNISLNLFNYTPLALSTDKDMLYVGTRDGGFLVYKKADWSLAKKFGDFALYDKMEAERNKISDIRPISPVLPIFIVFAGLFVIAFLIEGYSEIRKTSGKLNFRTFKKFLSSFMKASDALALILFASAIILILGIVNPKIVFPHFISNLKIGYYFDILVKRGALLPIWFMLPPVLTFWAMKKKKIWLRYLVSLVALIMAIAIYFLASGVGAGV